MRLLISPHSPLPIRIRAFLRWVIFKTRHNWKLFEYGEGCIVHGWVGWIEWRGFPICFEDTEGNLSFRW